MVLTRLFSSMLNNPASGLLIVGLHARDGVDGVRRIEVGLGVERHRSDRVSKTSGIFSHTPLVF